MKNKEVVDIRVKWKSEMTSMVAEKYWTENFD